MLFYFTMYLPSRPTTVIVLPTGQVSSVTDAGAFSRMQVSLPLISARTFTCVFRIEWTVCVSPDVNVKGFWP